MEAQKLWEKFSNPAFQITAELSYQVDNAQSDKILPRVRRLRSNEEM